MKTVKINKKVICLYDSIDELPILNFQKYNKYLLIDSGIGSTVDDIDTHILKIARFIKEDNKKKAILELQNMRQNMYMINSEISPKYLAFACLVHSIDGKINEDLSDEGLKGILEKIREVPHTWLDTLLQKCKKKLETDLDLYFPNEFVSVKEKSAYDKIKQRVLLVLDGIITRTDKSQEIENLDTQLFSTYTPNSFLGSDSVEIKYDKQFQTASFLIAQKLGLEVKKMTVLEFYCALTNIKEYSDLTSKRLNSHGRR